MLQRDGIAVHRGAQSEGSEAPPSTASLTLQDPDLAYNPAAPASTLYGLIGLNTPLRISADGSVRSTTEVASWDPERPVKGTPVSKLTGGGILRRLQQGKTPLREPLYRAIIDSGTTAFWPANDGTAAQSIASGLPGGPPMTFGGPMRLAAVPGPAGTVGAFPNLVAEAYETASGDNVGTYAGWAEFEVPALQATGWAVECVFLIEPIDPNVLSSVADVVTWQATGTAWTIMRISLAYSASTGLVDIFFGASGPGAFTVSCVSLAPGWHHARFLVTDSGADVQIQGFIDGVVEDTHIETGITLGVPTSGRYGNPAPGEFDVLNTRTAAIGYLAFTDFDLSPDNAPAATGHAGELAGQRFERLGAEEGIVAACVGDPLDTQPMGPQPVATFVDLLRECVRTDAGLMYESRTALWVVMRPGRDLYNQDPALELEFEGHVAPPLRPNLGDRYRANDVTAKRANGGQARAQKLTGPGNVADPVDDPQGVGRYDVQLDVNPAEDSTLLSMASWHMAKGTVEEPRWPAMVVHLDRAPGLISDVNALEIGDRITLSGLLAAWGLEDVASLLVIGIGEALPPLRRAVTLVTVPASPYEIGIVGANNGSTDVRGAAIDTDLSSLASGITTTGTALSVASTGGVLWTTDSDDWNVAQNGGSLYIVVGGERMRITNITGASSPQSFTVVRSDNGIVRAHLAGAAVHVAYPVRIGL